MTLRSLGLLISLVMLLFACGGKHDANVDGNSSGSGSGSDATVANCATFGVACVGDTDCCSGICDPTTATCAVNVAMCGAANTGCSSNTDCCSVSCVNSVCSGTQCVADNAACTTNGECCGGACGAGGTCTPLNTTCKTDGNPCVGGAECCSQACNASGHCGPSSYCTQGGDSCAHDAECCGGICNIASGQQLGTCTQPMTGATNCSAGVDGTVCTDCGGCCSRLCEVYAPTGVKICQPAEGCRVDGDLCHQDGDCCGAAGTGLPGDGHVTCIRQNSTDPVGVCRNPMACAPEGEICHYKNYQTCGNSSARNDCCGGLGGNPSAVCKLDLLGIPRCYGLGTVCRQAGQTCADSLDCCNGTPCVSNGMGQLVCGATACQQMGTTCTQTADCCNGSTCIFGNGQTYGTCGAGGTCQQSGQSCSATSACCSGATCIDTTTNAACGANQTTGCACYTPIF